MKEKRLVILPMVFLMAVGTCMAQLVPQKKADSVVVDRNALKYNPSVASDKPSRGVNSASAMDNATGDMKSAEGFFTDSLSGFLVGIAAETVGGIIKDQVSPDSYEAQKANREIERERR